MYSIPMFYSFTKCMGYDIKVIKTSLLIVEKSKVKIKISYENLNIIFFNIVRKLKYNNTVWILLKPWLLSGNKMAILSQTVVSISICRWAVLGSQTLGLAQRLALYCFLSQSGHPVLKWAVFYFAVYHSKLVTLLFSSIYVLSEVLVVNHGSF